jgi:CRISPR-associated protein Cmr4
MYQARAALFLYATSPVHMGASQAFGLIDNPIARERHTDHPVLTGSGLKGALRHRLAAEGGAWSSERLLTRLFGPETTDDDRHAGAVSIGDANLVAFPVRSLRRGYVYATSAHALSRLARALEQIGIAGFPPLPRPVEPGRAAVIHDGLLRGARLHLEAYEYEATLPQSGDGNALAEIARWLATNALPSSGAMAFFREKLAQDLILLSDEDLTWFARNATSVEPHVSIDPKTGTAADGKLFFTENLPVESLMMAPIMATRERTATEGLAAEAVLHHVTRAIHGEWVQVGGDATTGRGLMATTVLQSGGG